MPLLNWIVPWLIAGGVMWLVAYQMAPVGREIPLSHGLIAVILMGLCGTASNYYLKPVLGHWHILAEFVAHGVVVMAVFQLSFGRSVVAVLVYWLTLFLAGIVIALIAGKHKRSFADTGAGPAAFAPQNDSFLWRSGAGVS